MARRPQGDGPVVVAVTPGIIEAQMRKAVLESCGIPVLLQSQGLTHPGLRQVNVGPMGEVKLLVPATRAEEAAAILRSLEESDLGADEGADGQAFRATAREAAMRAEEADPDPEP